MYLIYIVYIFFFSSRRRHTICALVTGVQTCALPISGSEPVALPALPFGGRVISSTEALALDAPPERLAVVGAGYIGLISEERRVGKECVGTCRSRWWTYHYKKTELQQYT